MPRGFFSPLVSPKNNRDTHELSPQPIIEDIHGEPHYSQVVDGLLIKRGSNEGIFQVNLACGPLLKKRYINQKIEVELADFKIEIAEKFSKSIMNKTYRFPLANTQPH